MVTTKGLSTMRARERRKVRVPQAVFALLVFLGFLQARNFAAAMPGVMATHFGASGSANGWQTKGQFFILEIVMLGVCLLIGFGIIGIIAFSIMQSLGELSTLYPSGGAFTKLADRMVDKAFGVAVGWNYFIIWIAVLANEYNTLSAISVF